jgi:cis-3-alkyl-4-acyloxetan-2-one decarboxylase
MSQILSIAGVDVHVEGSGAETIVMVHGWPDTYRLWDDPVAALKDRFRCVRFTLPGFDAGKPRRKYTLDELVDFLKQVVEQAGGGGKVILMLHDWGCVFGYQFYVRHPQLVSRIVGIDVGDAKSTEKVLTVGGMLTILSYQLYLAVAWMIGGRFGDRMTMRMARAMRRPADNSQVSSCMDYPYFMTWFGGRRSYRRQFAAFVPTCPMLYLYAARKPVMFHAQGWLDDLVRVQGNEVVAFDSGHWIMLEQPERFNAVVSNWLSAAT